jgi:hypothetical protein
MRQPYKFLWNSSMCSCTVEFNDGKKKYKACDAEHESWLLIIGSQEVKRKLLEIERTVKRGIRPDFEFTLKRYGAEGTSFHRPQELESDATAPSAEMGFFLSESLGVRLVACSNPTRYADFIANKAVRGLTEKMWLEDWNASHGECTLFPAELVGDPQLCLPIEEANRLFGINMTEESVSLFR